MKRLFITLLFFSAFQFANAQQLKLADLKSFIKIDVSDVNDFLSEKNWKFIDNKKEEKHTITKFGFKTRFEIEPIKFFVNLTSREGYDNGVEYFENSAMNYSNLVAEIKSSGAKKLGSPKLENDLISTSYTDDKYIYITVSTNKTNHIIVADI